MGRILLAAPKSGSGKTMISCGLMRLFQRKGLRVQAIKCGPDYIDPMFHRRALGIPSGNIDTFFTEPAVTRRLLQKHSANAELTILEGVMGYYDGLGGVSVEASTYDVARVTRTPVILIVDCKGASVTIAATINGLLQFRRDHQIVGVLLNRVSKSFYPRLRQLIERECGISVVGYVPEKKDLAVPSRHLGLVSPEELVSIQSWADGIADVLEESVEWERLKDLAAAAPDLETEEVEALKQSGEPVFIGIAMDEAFSFYYEENKMLLEELGAILVPFSPLRDSGLPQNISGLLLGGGYPECYAGALMENSKMRREIFEKCSRGMPVLAECGGFLYLQETLEGLDGKIYSMAGVLPSKGYKTEKLKRFGYVTAQIQQKGLLGGCGEQIKGHEFHYWDSTECGEAFCMEKTVHGERYLAMHHTKSMAAGFPHFYYYSNPRMIENYLKACRAYERED